MSATIKFILGVVLLCLAGTGLAEKNTASVTLRHVHGQSALVIVKTHVDVSGNPAPYGDITSLDVFRKTDAGPYLSSWIDHNRLIYSKDPVFDVELAYDCTFDTSDPSGYEIYYLGVSSYPQFGTGSYGSVESYVQLPESLRGIGSVHCTLIKP